MRQEFKGLLDKLAAKFAASSGEKVEIVRSGLHIQGLLSISEHALVNSQILPSDKFKMMFNCLKEKTENLVFATLESICQENKWTNLAVDIEFGMVECLTNQVASTLEISDTCDDLDLRLKPLQDNLIRHLKDDVEFIYKYWDKLSASSDDCFANSYNGNIEIRNNSKTIFFRVSSFDELFEKQSFKRAIITAPAGYGKSTFVHEMVRQWVSVPKRSSKFNLIFLLRLGEIKIEETTKYTLKDVFERCLMINDAATLISMLDQRLCSDMLFVFDGFDEMNERLVSTEVMDIILGKSAMKPYVVVTCRPEKCLEKLKGAYNLNLELKGFTEKGILKQLNKSKTDCLFSTNERPDILKVPLFCTLFCIVQQSSKVFIDNHWLLIDSTLQYLLRRYEMAHPDLTPDKKNQLFFELGRTALPQIRQLRNYVENSSFHHLIFATFNDYTLPQSTINTAVSANLIMRSSSKYGIYFPHQMFAEYFAAFYISQTDSCKIQRILPSGDAFCFENNCCCLISSWLVYFLSHFNETFKLDLWTMLEKCQSEFVSVPLFVNYHTLPAIMITATSLFFDKSMTPSLVQCATGKLFVPAKILICSVTLTTSVGFPNQCCITELLLEDCDIKMPSAELLKTFVNVNFLTFRVCNIFDTNSLSEGHEFSCNNRSLKSITVDHCRVEDITFFPTLFELCPVVNVIDVEDEIVCLEWIALLNFSRSIKANLRLKKSGVEINFTDLGNLQTFLQDYNDDLCEHCVLRITQ